MMVIRSRNLKPKALHKGPRAYAEWTQFIYSDFESGQEGGSGSAHGDGEDSPRRRSVRLFDQHGQPLVWGDRAKVGF